MCSQLFLIHKSFRINIKQNQKQILVIVCLRDVCVCVQSCIPCCFTTRCSGKCNKFLFFSLCIFILIYYKIIKFSSKFSFQFAFVIDSNLFLFTLILVLFHSLCSVFALFCNKYLLLFIIAFWRIFPFFHFNLFQFFKSN